MGTDRNAIAIENLDALRQPGAAFQLDHIGAGLHERRGGFQRTFQGGGPHEGHISNDQAALIAPGHAFRVVGHLFQGHRYRAALALYHVSQGVPHQNGVYAGFRNQPGKTGVVSGEYGKFLAVLFAFMQGADGY